MSNSRRTFEDVRNNFESDKSLDAKGKVRFYDTWAENYEKDVVTLEYNVPSLAVHLLSSHFHGNREDALVLDVACGSGLVGYLMSKLGVRHFVGVDGSAGMLDQARKEGLYQDLIQCLLGTQPLPVQAGLFDVVMLVGGFGVGHVPVSVVRELCRATKPGGYVCMSRGNHKTAVDFRAAMESELEQMEEEGLWSRVEVIEVKQYMRDTSHSGQDYIGGCVYLYSKSKFNTIE